MMKSFLSSFVLVCFAFLCAVAVVDAQTYQPAGSAKGNWKTLGCANDLYPNARALNAAYSESSTGQATTIGRCIQFCDSQGAYLAGIEDGYQCFCGPSLDNGSAIKVNGQQISPSNNGGCTTPCRGNNAQNCGGPNALLVFQSTARPQPKIGSVSGNTYKGCYADNENNRLLPYVYQGNSNPSMTPSVCASGCTSRGYDLSGVEYRYQCFCGSSSSVNLGSALSAQRCETTCTGDNSVFCGGGGTLNVYQRTSSPPPTSSPTPKQTVTAATGVTYKYIGCVADSSSRTLNGPSFSDPTMTVEKCVSYCYGQNKQKYAGLEYSTECYCGSAFTKYSTAPNCNMACAGDGSETCGGGYALTTYQLSS